MDIYTLVSGPFHGQLAPTLASGPFRGQIAPTLASSPAPTLVSGPFRGQLSTHISQWSVSWPATLRLTPQRL